MSHHHVPATPETTRWGSFSADFPPVLIVESGDSVTLECVSGGPDMLPDPSLGFTVHPALPQIHAANRARGSGVHILTGPVAVRGAEPGDTLEVRIERVELGADWGFCAFRPLAGTLPEDFPRRLVSHIAIDQARHTGRLPWGGELPLAPFFGVMGTAPPAEYGAISTKEPREHGGNLDNKELVEGSTLLLPVWTPGALFSAGDGHGVQGDGEVCINALETALTGTFRLILHKGARLRFPRAESPTHHITMGLNEDLDQAMKQAVREMIALICERSDLSPDQAYQFCSLAVDFHVTQTVNGEKGIHGMLRKGLLF